MMDGTVIDGRAISVRLRSERGQPGGGGARRTQEGELLFTVYGCLRAVVFFGGDFACVWCK